MNNVIIGLGFGDEGKGLFTDYLCSHYTNPLVVRYTGGHQVGHTVVTDDNSHVFSNFGSGTLKGATTYWSKYCTVEPVGLLKELNILLEKGIVPKLSIDSQCPITTPYDILSNKLTEYKNLHGSIGVGYGATLNREENYYSLKFGDLFYPDVFKTKLKAIKDFYHFDTPTEKYTIDLKPFYEAVDMITSLNYIKKVTDVTLCLHTNHIYEGAQGLLLDKHFGFFPNVTRSNLGTRNILELDKNGLNLELFLVTRAYQTRHGNGFMTNETIPHNILSNPYETNTFNTYQGKFRKTLLDVSLLEYAIEQDPYIRNSDKNLVITCLDHIIRDYRFTYRGEIIHCKNEENFVQKICEILKIKSVYLSRSPNSKNIEHRQLIKEKIK